MDMMRKSRYRWIIVAGKPRSTKHLEHSRGGENNGPANWVGEPGDNRFGSAEICHGSLHMPSRLYLSNLLSNMTARI